MRIAIALGGVALAAGFAFAGPDAEAASFNCADASHPDEYAICQNEHLSILDSVMAQVWKINKDMPYLMGERGALQDSQENFLKERSGCGADIACLTPLYQKRIDDLSNMVTSFAQGCQ